MNVNAEQLRAILGFRHPEGMTYFDRLVDEAHVVRAARRAKFPPRAIRVVEAGLADVVVDIVNLVEASCRATGRG